MYYMNKIWYEMHKQEYNARRREKYRSNPEKTKELNRLHYQNRKVKFLETLRNRYHNDIEWRKRRDERNRKYRSTRKYKDKRNSIEREKLKYYRNKVFEILGGYVCGNCGYNVDKRVLQVDHIYGGGNKERKLGYTYATWKKYAEDPELTKAKFQVLCANCNILKRYENNEF